MKIAHISGTNYLNFVKLGDIAFSLTHHILNNKDYARFYRNCDMYKITDNSAAELGESIDIDDVIHATRKVKANEVWAADKLYDKRATLKLTKKFIEHLSERDLKRMKIVAIPQGKNLREWISCYKKMMKMPQVDVIAISKYSVEAFNKLAGTKDFSICRQACLKYLANNFLLEKTLHCAGANHLIINEIMFMKKFPIVRSIDSNIAFKLGSRGLKINTCTEEPKKRLNHDIVNVSQDCLNTIRYNIKEINKTLK